MIASLHRSMRIKAHAVSTELKALSAMTKCAFVVSSRMKAGPCVQHQFAGPSSTSGS